ncbi:hypothetical protein [Sandaracinobacteroides saxicola]|uniref:Uncharacterized protein n=1 Tax=Sandaracinobacteroides saxicola TaxID=2759707 RepID=A0A7G5IEM3_9SPHN|nr:hypothetical protein [Sandaracinobacteroides saxicola]QMW21815.1 hypothetical protein H3309_10450 [Sandaracinobacteroides saxicola]
MPIELATISQGVSLINGLRSFRPPGRRAQRQRDAVVGMLRGIYFTPRGTRLIVQSLAEGRVPDLEDVEAILPDFNDREWSIRDFVDQMRFENHDLEEIGLANRRTLEQIGWGKINLRRDIQDLINSAATGGEDVQPEEAQALLDRVNELNRMIEELEREFL